MQSPVMRLLVSMFIMETFGCFSLTLTLTLTIFLPEGPSLADRCVFMFGSKTWYVLPPRSTCNIRRRNNKKKKTNDRTVKNGEPC